MVLKINISRVHASFFFKLLNQDKNGFGMHVKQHEFPARKKDY